MFTSAQIISARLAPEGTPATVGSPAPSTIVRPKTRLVTVKMAGYDLAIPYVLTELTNGDAILRYCVDPQGALAAAAESPVQQGVKPAASAQAAVRAAFIAARGSAP